MKKAENKPKKNKPMYIDDGSTIADMSWLGAPGQKSGGAGRYRSSLKEKFQTYISAVKLMFLPMLAVLGIITVAFLLVYLIL